MSEETGAADAEADGESDVWSRETAPQTPFTMRQVGIGLALFVLGVAVAFGLPLLLL